jgi:hypothetical protein
MGSDEPVDRDEGLGARLSVEERREPRAQEENASVGLNPAQRIQRRNR